MNNPAKINRSRRLRKKLYMDEFSILGFGFTCALAFENEAELNIFFGKFIDFVESKNLHVAGGADDENFDGFITSIGRYDSATEEDRTDIQNWLTAQEKVSEVLLGKLEDPVYADVEV